MPIRIAPLSLLLALASLACAHPSRAVSSAARTGEIALADDTVLRPLADGAWLVTTTRAPDETANALLLATGDRSVLVDTGWSPRQAGLVLTWAERTLGRPIAGAMITSADDDRIGGVPALLAAGVPVFASGHTAAETTLALSPLEPDSIPELHWMFVRIDPDPEAIAVYHAATRIVFAGRFVDALAAGAVTRSDDADHAGLRAALDLVTGSYPDAALVVPGRGEPGTLALVEHTRTLVAECHDDAECRVLTEELAPCACCRCIEPRASAAAAIDQARAMQPSCEPICGDPSGCPTCATREDLEHLRATCVRGECTLAHE